YVALRDEVFERLLPKLSEDRGVRAVLPEALKDCKEEESAHVATIGSLLLVGRLRDGQQQGQHCDQRLHRTFSSTTTRPTVPRDTPARPRAFSDPGRYTSLA